MSNPAAIVVGYGVSDKELEAFALECYKQEADYKGKKPTKSVLENYMYNNEIRERFGKEWGVVKAVKKARDALRAKQESKELAREKIVLNRIEFQEVGYENHESGPTIIYAFVIENTWNDAIELTPKLMKEIAAVSNLISRRVGIPPSTYFIGEQT